MFMTYTVLGKLESAMKYVITIVNQLPHVLKGIRKQKSLRQIDIQKRTGMLQKTVSALENHPETVSIESFMKLLSALDLELCLQDKQKETGEF
jgi:HTH-type transcriptional regulator/antitoxin HipB